ncbi:MAG: hypothetical protein A2086_03445 [Spirochaetes bacterium GWD1_27_9]|nr:MAG: hypothetical protein A2Z98_18275 [Spirochaetes bacterium GWB1_27_13]OHD24094.1 MAG: hypothetical protein A2Y34_09315 [Spirochaetes bacterium GWC1_27_15]OHD36787.1 MAG: hypothetical protein A2086_03445 [Spirochaetes bacterium GWD1_27_9]
MKNKIVLFLLFVFLVIFLMIQAGCNLSGTENNSTTVTTKGSNGIKLPIGMNIAELNYYTPQVIFTDVMTTASPYRTPEWGYLADGDINLDENGYPIGLPQTRKSDGKSTYIRFLVNDYYKGKYRILYQGKGTLGGNVTLENSKYYITLDGLGEHKWIDILTSDPTDYIRSIKILPIEYENGEPYPTFLKKFLDGLRTFHALRFMDSSRINFSIQVNWSDRVTKTYYTQGGDKGVSFDYAIDLCNEIDADAWVCVPHKATDDYIRNMAKLWRDNLKSGKKIYLEFSNETWNWSFSQSQYIVNNAPDAVDVYVSQDLAAIGTAGINHPEKDAYMMARCFKIWGEEFSGSPTRLVKVATGQHAWVDNSRRILEYLFKVAKVPCDAFAIGGYFSFTEEDHNNWLTSTPSPEKICEDTLARFATTSELWTKQSAAYAAQYGVDFLVYEGGQHMQPYQQQVWSYNDNLYEAQINPKIYDLYIKNFSIHTDASVDCKLFIAWNYIGTRKSKYGSWGHLESLDQVGGNYSIIAPKFQALLDCNTPK